MKWLGKWILKLVHQAAAEEREAKIFGTSSNSVSMGARIRSSEDVDGDEGLNITVRKAIGGRIVTFRHYDHKNDRNNYKLYVIPDELDFERELGKMITLESMRG